MFQEIERNLPGEIYKRLLRGIKNLMPPQEEALRRGIFSEKNFVISSPTASGKTLIAEMAFCKEILKGKKAVYVVPLRSLAFEKYQEFKEKYEGVFKVALSVGDYDSDDPWLKEYDLIIVTAEKLDSLMRHKASWLKDVGLLVVDEVHLLGDLHRGSTLEILITKFRMMSNPRVVCLSATIENAKEIADWLDAELVKSDWRPCELHHLIFLDGKLINKYEKKLKTKYKDVYRALCEDTLSKGKQIIFFMSSRKKTENLAKKLSTITNKFLTDAERMVLKHISEEIKNVLEIPTDQCILLSDLVKKGIAFHHAGLLNEQRALVEKGFREGWIKVICATPTLAMGVNLPAFRVFIDKMRRNEWISPIEYHQMAGRAGRPKYEKYGEAVTYAKDEEEAELIKERYHSGKLNIIKSSLFVESLLRMHLLSLIAEGFIYDRNSLIKFFEKTFFSYQFKDIENLMRKCEDIISQFIDWNFVKKENKYLLATRLGKRVSELYIDPLTAHRFIDFMRKSKKVDEIYVLYSISSSEEMKPLPEFGVKEFPVLREFYERNIDSIPEKEPEAWLWSDFYSRIKMTIILYNWVNEVPEKKIMERFGISPGDLRNYISIAEWLTYAMSELGKLINFQDYKYIRSIMGRIRYGIREELLELVKIRYVGRVRARLLYNTGIRSKKDIVEAGLNRMKSLLGEKIGEKVYYSALGKEEKRKRRLTDFF